jgi:hypothetical protein
MELVGTVAGLAFLGFCYFLLVKVAPVLPFMPKIAACKNCGHEGLEDFSVFRGLAKQDAVMTRDTPTWAPMLFVALFIGAIFLAILALKNFLWQPPDYVRALGYGAAACFVIVWGMRFLASYPVRVCGKCVDRMYHAR